MAILLYVTPNALRVRVFRQRRLFLLSGGGHRRQTHDNVMASPSNSDVMSGVFP